MAIKVKHDVNAAPMAVASAESGRAKRQVETARMLQNQRTQAMQGAHASPISPGQSHAPTLQAHAPNPVNWRLQRRENEAQEAARAALADQNNLAAMDRAQMGIDADAARLRAQQEFNAQQSELARRQQADLAAQGQDFQLMRDQQNFEQGQREWERRNNIMRTQRDEDLVAAGTHEWGYTDEQNRAIDEMWSDFDRQVAEGRLSPEQRAQAEREIQAKIDAMPKRAVRRTDPEALFNQNTYTDAGGRIFTTDGRLVYNPADAQTREQDRLMRMMDAEDKRYIDAVLKLQQGRRRSEPIYETDPLSDKPVLKGYKDVYTPYTPEEEAAVLQRLFPNRFADVGAPNPNPAPQPGAQGGSASAQTPPPARPAQEVAQTVQTPAPVARTVEDAKKKWGVRN